MTKRDFEFYKNESGEWFIDLPEWKGDPADLQMVEGADEWLELLCNSQRKLTVTMSDSAFEGHEVLTLLRTKEANLGGGGIYYLENYGGQKIALKLWLCEVTELVFKCLPQKIYFS